MICFVAILIYVDIYNIYGCDIDIAALLIYVAIYNIHGCYIDICGYIWYMWLYIIYLAAILIYIWLLYWYTLIYMAAIYNIFGSNIDIWLIYWYIYIWLLYWYLWLYIKYLAAILIWNAGHSPSGTSEACRCTWPNCSTIFYFFSTIFQQYFNNSPTIVQQ